VDSIPTGAGLEDHVSMAPIAGRHALKVVENAARVVALELICACRALEFRRPLAAGAGSERLFAWVRRRVASPEGDRPFSGDCERLAAAILAGDLTRLSEEVLKS
jgi:histidine ammonia-lyase